MNAYDIFEHILNLQDPKVYKTIEVPDGLGDTKEKCPLPGKIDTKKHTKVE